MPTYDYECPDCGARFEKFQQMVEEALKECPECGGQVKRLIGVGSGFIFKGSGFYATDYAKKDPKRPVCEKEAACPAKGETCEGKTCDKKLCEE